MNGTGKSTISKALKIYCEDKNFDDFKMPLSEELINIFKEQKDSKKRGTYAQTLVWKAYGE
jgi:hypothetical protein